MNSSWQKMCLGDICSPKQWQTLSTSDLLKNGYPVYGANGKIGFHSTFNHKEEVIAITCRGATCGNVTLTEPYSYVTGNSMCLDKLSKNISTRFLHYYLLTKGLEKLVSGSAQPQITRVPLQQLSILVPPLPEQKKIAEILDGIDNTIQKHEESIKKYEILYESLLINFVERCQKSYEEVGLNKYLISIDSGWSPNCLKRLPNREEWGILKTTSVTWKGFNERESKALPSQLSPRVRLCIKRGDVLVTRAGPAERVGVVAVVEKERPRLMISDKLIRLRCNQSLLNPFYLGIFLRSSIAQNELFKDKVGMAVSQSNISQQSFKRMSIRIPPLKEQEKIVQILSSVEKTKNRSISLVRSIKKLKQALSSDLLSGRKRVNV